MNGPNVLDEGGPIYAWTKGVQLEAAAREQLAKISRLPVVAQSDLVNVVATLKQIICVKG